MPTNGFLVIWSDFAMIIYFLYFVIGLFWLFSGFRLQKYITLVQFCFFMIFVLV